MVLPPGSGSGVVVVLSEGVLGELGGRRLGILPLGLGWGLYQVLMGRSGSLAEASSRNGSE